MDTGREFEGGVSVSEIFREIDEELRRDNLLKLWQRYGRYIIAAVVVAVAIAAGVAAWRNHQLSLRQAQSVRYQAALSLLRAGKNADAAKMFATIGDENGGYGRLAAFEAADLTAKNDAKAATAAYDKIASSDASPELRDAAMLMAVMNGFADTDPKAVIDRLQPLTATGNPWRASALELTAAAKLKAGDKPGALDIYKKLADDLAAPEGTRKRAAEMAAVLGS